MSPRTRQITAIGAILVGVGALAALVALFWNSWWALLIGSVCVVVATWAAWFVLSRRGLVRGIAAAVMVAAFVAALVALVRDHSVWRVVLVLALGLAASGLARLALGEGDRQLRAQAPPGVRTPPARHPVLIYNPKSG